MLGRDKKVWDCRSSVSWAGRAFRAGGASFYVVPYSAVSQLHAETASETPAFDPIK